MVEAAEPEPRACRGMVDWCAGSTESPALVQFHDHPGPGSFIRCDIETQTAMLVNERLNSRELDLTMYFLQPGLVFHRVSSDLRPRQQGAGSGETLFAFALYRRLLAGLAVFDDCCQKRGMTQ